MYNCDFYTRLYTTVHGFGAFYVFKWGQNVAVLCALTGFKSRRDLYKPRRDLYKPRRDLQRKDYSVELEPDSSKLKSDSKFLKLKNKFSEHSMFKSK